MVANINKIQNTNQASKKTDYRDYCTAGVAFFSLKKSDNFCDSTIVAALQHHVRCYTVT